MTFSRKSQWIIFLSINAVLALGVILFPFYIALAKLIPIGECALLKLGLYCPACGGTRALSALLRFDVIDAFKYNPIVPLSALALAVYEVLMIKHLIKGGERKILLTPKQIYIFLALWGIYFVVRNVLLAFGIDLIGDILV